MAHDAKKAGLVVNKELLQTYGRHDGQHHDECRVGISFLFFWTLKWRVKARKVVPKATYHPSVMQRFKEPSVLIYDQERPYRPGLLAEHVDSKPSISRRNLQQVRRPPHMSTELENDLSFRTAIVVTRR